MTRMETRERELDRVYSDLANWLDSAPADVWPLIAEGRHDMIEESRDRIARRAALDRLRSGALRQRRAQRQQRH